VRPERYSIIRNKKKYQTKKKEHACSHPLHILNTRPTRNPAGASAGVRAFTLPRLGNVRPAGVSGPQCKDAAQDPKTAPGGPFVRNLGKTGTACGFREFRGELASPLQFPTATVTTRPIDPHRMTVPCGPVRECLAAPWRRAGVARSWGGGRMPRGERVLVTLARQVSPGCRPCHPRARSTRRTG
jgi:hypothetical protein